MESTFQSTLRWWTVLVFLWIGYSTVVHTEGAKGFGITCKTCVRGTTAKVTCHFTEDLNASQADFSLYHKGPHDAADTLVMGCGWVGKRTIFCNPVTKYIPGDEVSDRFEVEIHNANSQDHDGEYTCRVVGESNKPFTPCTLNITSVPGPPTDLHIQNVTLESAKICLKPPPDTGQQVHYRVRYRPRNSSMEYRTVDFRCPTDACVVISGLNPGTEYEIAVLAFNDFGESSYADVEDSVETLSMSQTETSDTITLPIVVFAALTALAIAGVAIAYKRNYIRCGRKPPNRKEPSPTEGQIASSGESPTTKSDGSLQDTDLEKGQQDKDVENDFDEKETLMKRGEPEGEHAGEIQGSPKFARKEIKEDADEGTQLNTPLTE